MLLIMNIGAKSANYIEKSLCICLCQVAKYDHPHIGNINNVNEDGVSLWQKVIRYSKQLSEEDIYINYGQDDSIYQVITILAQGFRSQ